MKKRIWFLVVLLSANAYGSSYDGSVYYINSLHDLGEDSEPYCGTLDNLNLQQKMTREHIVLAADRIKSWELKSIHDLIYYFTQATTCELEKTKIMSLTDAENKKLQPSLLALVRSKITGTNTDLDQLLLENPKDVFTIDCLKEYLECYKLSLCNVANIFMELEMVKYIKCSYAVPYERFLTHMEQHKEQSLSRLLRKFDVAYELSMF